LGSFSLREKVRMRERKKILCREFLTKYIRAKIFSQKGKKTELFGATNPPYWRSNAKQL
jgi:hypothetical protein